jgi:hypothetical protein
MAGTIGPGIALTSDNGRRTRCFPQGHVSPCPSIGSHGQGHSSAEPAVQQEGRMPARPWKLEALEWPLTATLAAESCAHNDMANICPQAFGVRCTIVQSPQ